MNTKDTGGTAFPFSCQGPTTAPEIYYGMTLRDYFAAKAMQGLQANPIDEVSRMGFDELAEYSYKMADAMLKARES